MANKTVVNPRPTREELYLSVRGEREKIEEHNSLTQPLRLPITRDGCEALMERVTAALEIPLDDTMRSVFSGYLHSLPRYSNSFTLGDLGKAFWHSLSMEATWKFDQECKERLQELKLKEKLEADKDKIVEVPVDLNLVKSEEEPSTVTQ